MILQNNPQSFSPQNDASLWPAEGVPLPPSLSPSPHNSSGDLSNDVQDLLFIHGMPIPCQPFLNDQTWMLGRPMGADPTLLVKNRSMNPDIGITPLRTPSQSNPRATRGNHHFPGEPLGRSTAEER